MSQIAAFKWTVNENMNEDFQIRVKVVIIQKPTEK